MIATTVGGSKQLHAAIFDLHPVSLNGFTHDLLFD